MKIAFRVDGGKSIGLGHIMRCLTLANEFRKKDMKVYFLSKYDEGIKKVEENELDVIKLYCDDINDNNYFNYGDIKKLDEEALEIIKILKEKDIDTLILDSYNISEDYLLKLKENLKILAYIDDVNLIVYPIDILINGNIFATDMNYKKYFYDEVMLLGSKYNLIRAEFKDLPKRILKKEVKNIMITTGGSDPKNITCKIINKLLKDDYFKKISFNVIVGSGFTNKEDIYLLSKRNKNINIHENPTKISDIMLNSDIAISSGGSTLYELCSCGTPTLAFIYADNQVPLVEKLDSNGYIKSIGWYNGEFNLLESLKNLINNFSKRLDMSSRGQDLVDGRGSERVVNAIIENMRGVKCE